MIQKINNNSSRYKCIAAIVTFKNPSKMVRKAVTSFLKTNLKVKLCIIDNSPSRDLEKALQDLPIEYCFMNSNLGFGKANNYAIQNREECDYFLALNPDIFFHEGTLEKLIGYMDENMDIGLIMPKILYEDGSTQYLCKLLPTPVNTFIRRFSFSKSLISKMNYQYEMRFADYNKIMEVPFLSGCFMLFREAVFSKVNGFDERYFMYFEDVDISRRTGQHYRTIYYPEAKVYHQYARESYKNPKLALYQIASVIKYFNKWGWFWDSERTKINQRTILNYSSGGTP